MKCDEATVLLHALADGELDAVHAREIEAHAVGCPRCAPQLVATRELRQAMQDHRLRYAAPRLLRASLEQIVPTPAATTSRRSLLKGFAFGSLISAATAAGLTLVIVGKDRDNLILNEAVSAHLRSLQAEHLTDVLSTDQHTVKPWFNGRIELAPPVADLTAQGFTLIGGRLDYIDGRPVAVLVYRRRVHVINLFVMQDQDPALLAPAQDTFRGFNIVRWSGHGLSLLAVSDLNKDELKEFQMKFEAAS